MSTRILRSRFRSWRGGGGVRYVIEVKNADPVSDAQLRRYKEHLGKGAQVVSLAPLGAEPTHEQGVWAYTWQELGADVAAWRGNPEVGGEQWLVGEFIDFLEERGVAATEPLDEATTRGLSVLGATTLTTRAIIAAADFQVKARLGEACGPPSRPDSAESSLRDLSNVWRCYRTPGWMAG